MAGTAGIRDLQNEITKKIAAPVPNIDGLFPASGTIDMANTAKPVARSNWPCRYGLHRRPSGTL